MNVAIETCALCPRLCRHSCPVAVGTGLESTTPTAIMALLVHPQQQPELSRAAVDLCTQCGACEDHCGLDQPVRSLLAEARAALHPPLPPWNPPIIHGHSQTVAVICGTTDWSADLSAVTDQDVATLHTTDHLGEVHRARTDATAATLERLETLFNGRTAVVECHTCREALEAASVSVEMLDALLPRRPSRPTWRTCRCAASPGVRTLQNCCGARGPLSTTHPSLANEMAHSLRKRLDGQAVYTPDARCAAHMQGAGANVIGPVDLLPPHPQTEE